MGYKQIVPQNNHAISTLCHKQLNQPMNSMLNGGLKRQKRKKRRLSHIESIQQDIGSVRHIAVAVLHIIEKKGLYLAPIKSTSKHVTTQTKIRVQQDPQAQTNKKKNHVGSSKNPNLKSFFILPFALLSTNQSHLCLL